VGAGSSTTFQIKFDPASTGTKTATVSFSNNDSNENPYDFRIVGSAVVIGEPKLRLWNRNPTDWGTKSPGSTISGTMDVQMWNNSPNALCQTVIGIRDSAGNWVGGEPQVIVNTIPEMDSDGSTYSGRSFSNLTLPTTPGTYMVWSCMAQQTSNAGAISYFKSLTPATENEMNRTVGPVVVILPDLSWDSPSLIATPANVSAGSSVHVAGTYRISGQDVSGLQIYYRLSPDQTYDDSDLALGAEYASGTVGSHTSSFDCILPSPITGTYYIVAKLDVHNTIAESNENNNTGASNAIQPKPENAKIDVELVAVATPNSADTASTLPTSLNSVRPGQAFYVEAWLKNRDFSVNGITGGYLDFAFDKTKVTGGTLSHGGIYTNLPSGIIDNANGKVDDFGGNAAPGVIDKGDNEWVRLGYVSFTVGTGVTGNAIFTAAPGIDTIARAGEGAIAWSNVELNTPQLSIPVVGCMYDLDNSGRIGTGDYAVFSAAWHGRPGDHFWNPACDFDKRGASNGYIDTADYSWLSSNWLKYTTDPTITYPPNVSILPAKRLMTLAEAPLAIDVELLPVASLSTGDTAAALPTTITQAKLGSIFYVEVWAKNIDGSTRGITGGYLDFSFESALVSAGTISHGKLYTNLTGGSVLQSSGLIDDLGGNAAPGVIDKGNDEWVRIGYVPFTAMARGTVHFNASPGIDTMARAGEGSIAWAQVQLNSPTRAVTISSDPPPAQTFRTIFIDSKNRLLYISPSSKVTKVSLPKMGNISSPAWSTDGQWIVFCASPTYGVQQVWVVRPDGSGRRRVTNGYGDLSNPDFSPDGKRIVFSSRQSGLCMINFDGTGETALGVFGVHPTFSPDGRFIAYSNWGQTYESDVFIYDLRKKTIRQLTRRSEAGEAFNYANWSPDGKKLIVNRLSSARTYELVVINRVTGSERSLTPTLTNSDEAWASWAPDGQSIVFQSNMSGINSIWSINSTGGGLRQLTNWADGAYYPSCGQLPGTKTSAGREAMKRVFSDTPIEPGYLLV